MRPTAHTFRSWCLALFLLAAAGLAGCRSVKSVSVVNANTSVQETVGLLEQGVTAIARRTALDDIGAWQIRLRAEDVPALDEIADTLDDLEAELQADTIDGAAAGRLLRRLGEQTSAAAQRDGAPDRLDRLGQLLSQAGQQLQ